MPEIFEKNFRLFCFFISSAALFQKVTPPVFDFRQKFKARCGSDLQKSQKEEGKDEMTRRRLGDKQNSFHSESCFVEATKTRLAEKLSSVLFLSKFA